MTALIATLAAICFGVVFLAWGCWRLSLHAWRSDDVARGADVPRTLDEIQARRARSVKPSSASVRGALREGER